MPLYSSNAGVATLLLHIRALGIQEPVLEHRFHDKRKWRFDIAWIDQKVAVEVDGGVYTRGRHVRPQGYINDCEKINNAVLLGWRVLRFTPDQIKSGQALEFIKELL